ncbi:MAG: septum formation initiator family protein [Aeriscardovia aeriphila]|nr:septum formation initiator family protein [Aeriscardovia aeriphila]
MVILLVALVPFMGTLRDYNASSSQLVSLQDKAEELSKQKRELDLQIGRWDDNNYVVDQARTRLGFIYPGEVSVRVIGKEKYQSTATATAKTQNTGKAKSEWYKLWQRSLKRSDKAAHRDQKVSQAVPPAQQEQQEKDQNANQG